MESSIAHAQLRVVPHRADVSSGSTTQKDCALAVPSIAAVGTGPAAPPRPNGDSVVPGSISAVSTRESAAFERGLSSSVARWGEAAGSVVANDRAIGTVTTPAPWRSQGPGYQWT
jgi:hypothetical protein